MRIIPAPNDLPINRGPCPHPRPTTATMRPIRVQTTRRNGGTWQTLADKELLQVRLRDLNLSIEGSGIEECLADLYEELARRDIRFRPHAWLSYDWFVPDG